MKKQRGKSLFAIMQNVILSFFKERCFYLLFLLSASISALLFEFQPKYCANHDIGHGHEQYPKMPYQLHNIGKRVNDSKKKTILI